MRHRRQEREDRLRTLLIAPSLQLHVRAQNSGLLQCSDGIIERGGDQHREAAGDEMRQTFLLIVRSPSGLESLQLQPENLRVGADENKIRPAWLNAHALQALAGQRISSSG